MGRWFRMSAAGCSERTAKSTTPSRLFFWCWLMVPPRFARASRWRVGSLASPIEFASERSGMVLGVAGAKRGLPSPLNSTTPGTQRGMKLCAALDAELIRLPEISSATRSLLFARTNARPGRDGIGPFASHNGSPTGARPIALALPTRALRPDAVFGAACQCAVAALGGRGSHTFIVQVPLFRNLSDA